MSLFETLSAMSKQHAIIEHVATCRDGGSMLLKFGGEDYLLDHGIGSKTRGRIFKGSNHQERESITPDLDIRIRASYSDKYGKCLPFEESGSYTFEKPSEPQSAPTVSLYNLLDQPIEYLDFLLDCAKKREEELRPMKLALNESYMKAVSWMTIISGAIREKKDRDSEAWAEKTAKEINETI